MRAYVVCVCARAYMVCVCVCVSVCVLVCVDVKTIFVYLVYLAVNLCRFTSVAMQIREWLQLSSVLSPPSTLLFDVLIFFSRISSLARR